MCGYRGRSRKGDPGLRDWQGGQQRGRRRAKERGVRAEAGRVDQFLECPHVGRKLSGSSIIHVQ